jgi:5'-deoxynucleotidase YfbR-like HD superfamily hydrolase
VEERRGTRRDRFARLAGRGREETTPVAAHLYVAAAVGLLVFAILAISLVLWLVLR